MTAGVLRADKGRFQLFGDTVNTASRMESNGVKGRIHVSDATAALLPAKYLIRRQDKVHAKGKGEMTTYFVDILNGGGSLEQSIQGFSWDTSQESEGKRDDENGEYSSETEPKECP